MARSPNRRIVLADLPLQVWVADGLPIGLIIRVVNVDPETGARTLMVDIPAGWEQPVAHWHSADEEFYVLAGELESGKSRYRAGHYVFRPAGSLHGPTRALAATTLIYWHEGPFDIRTDAPPPPASITKPLVDGLDTTVAAEHWDILPVKLPKDIAMIRMRDAETSGCDNTLEWLPLGFESHAREFHTADEEIFILDGWASTDTDHVYPAGHYLFWEAGIVHGPTRAWNCRAIVKHYGKHETVHVPFHLNLRHSEPERRSRS